MTPNRLVFHKAEYQVARHRAARNAKLQRCYIEKAKMAYSVLGGEIYITLANQHGKNWSYHMNICRGLKKILKEAEGQE